MRKKSGPCGSSYVWHKRELRLCGVLVFWYWQRRETTVSRMRALLK